MKRKCNIHHLRPRSRGGERISSNEIIMYYDRHISWHRLWDMKIPSLDNPKCLMNIPRTLREIIDLLKSLKKLKRSPDWIIMWGEKRTLQDVIQILERVYRIKKQQEFYLLLN